MCKRSSRSSPGQKETLSRRVHPKTRLRDEFQEERAWAVRRGGEHYFAFVYRVKLGDWYSVIKFGLPDKCYPQRDAEVVDVHLRVLRRIAARCAVAAHRHSPPADTTKPPNRSPFLCPPTKEIMKTAGMAQGAANAVPNARRAVGGCPTATQCASHGALIVDPARTTATLSGPFFTATRGKIDACYP
ncbi:hypothetical protein MRX96_041549 [Rhipicephalus microplus]